MRWFIHRIFHFVQVCSKMRRILAPLGLWLGSRANKRAGKGYALGYCSSRGV